MITEGSVGFQSLESSMTKAWDEHIISYFGPTDKSEITRIRGFYRCVDIRTTRVVGDNSTQRWYQISWYHF